ncbi:hypothetical protein F5Y00DRAFT_266560 [Daldinia vernicosa]|uniref:uncharacterized protein n=1 Tax=Daldinia vernicosa TaxID=114800 RepID=UPI002007F198|nr:uncharacterized protein F5Y00DRAFT_266560 [Daldinia vernicosa]KAI0844402.1 hypothetical protein F5Y00DRAFT_266560 [Daldinia vernicosa]
MEDRNKIDQFVSLYEFRETPGTIPESFSDLLESYSGIPKNHQLEHILKVRKEAYAVFPYPCLGAFIFFELNLCTHPAYQEHVLNPLKQACPDGAVEPLFLDLGSCFGQDLRKLVYDGARASRIWASDIDPELINLGFKLFKDEHKLPRDHFPCPGDLLSNSPEDKLRALDDKVTILHLSHVFHCFSPEEQKVVINRCLRLLRKDTGQPVLVIGIQGGSAVPTAGVRGCTKYIHSEQSWKDLWDEVREGDVWKERIKALDVKSELRKLREGPETELGWLVFEVWITFV